MNRSAIFTSLYSELHLGLVLESEEALIVLCTDDSGQTFRWRFIVFILLTTNTVCTMQAVYFYARKALYLPVWWNVAYILVSDTRLWEFESPHGQCRCGVLEFDICPCDGCTACTTLVRLWKAFVQAEASIDGGLDFDICPCDGIGIHTWLRTKVLRVRISPRILRRIGATGRRSSFKNCQLRVRLPYPAVHARTTLP